MEDCVDFLPCMGTDMLLNIFECLDDPADLIRATAVSRCWRDFVIANGLAKQLCVGLLPQLANIENITEPNCTTRICGFTTSMEWKILKWDHKFYASLLQELTKLKSSPVSCIAKAFTASSTEFYPLASIDQTLRLRDQYASWPSYWSSTGHQDPSVPETLIYRLKADICVITKIDIKPFAVYFERGKPIYSAKSVRFRMGHPKSPMKIEHLLSSLPLLQPADDRFIWTYTSQEFAMTQENSLQQFKLPEPVLCIGGFLQIELLGRVQRRKSDRLFYICVSLVKVLGLPLSPAFHIQIRESSGKILLKYFSDALHQEQLKASNNIIESQVLAPVRGHGCFFSCFFGLLFIIFFCSFLIKVLMNPLP